MTSFRVTARRVHSWVWWLLPLLVARALVPVGFMAKANERGELQIVMCQAGAPGLLKAALQSAADQHDPAGQSDNSPHWQHDSSCPFAHAAAAPVAHSGSVQQIAFIASSEVSATGESLHLAAGPPRRLTNRGPPV